MINTFKVKKERVDIMLSLIREMKNYHNRHCWLSASYSFIPPSCLFIFIFLFFSFIFISWKLITLQYCSGFCHTLTWISQGFTCIPHPNPPSTSLSTQSLWVFPVHQARALVSCIQPGLVICFTLDNKHVSMLFSRNIPPSPSPTESKSVFCTSVSLSVLHIGLSLPSF